MSNNANPFELNVSDETLSQIRARISDYPWHEMPDDGGWDYGTNMTYLRELCEYWATQYDWRRAEAAINAFDHFKVSINGIDMHYIIEKGSGDAAQPLLLCHGWPGTVMEFNKIIDQLAHPEQYGGDIADAFDVIVPSMPGFGFSGRPPRPYGPRAIAGVFNSLMVDHLGYDSYIAQGGDWGAAVTSWLGYEHDACCAIHINVLTMRHPDGPQTVEEQDWSDAFDAYQIMEDGYRTQQATRPQTLSYAMMDSPVGTAAWILEKFKSWSDIEGDNVESAHSKDDLLTNIMIYIVTRTFNTASWIYYGRREEGGRVFSPEGDRVEVPTACAVFPKEMLIWPPKSYADRLYNITQWTQMPCGGHFAALEQPQLLLEDIRKFSRSLT